LRDAVELEWAGVPSVAIIHETMAGTAQAMASVSGMPDYEFITVGYPYVPLVVWSPEEIRAVAKQVAPQVLKRLTTNG